MASSRVAFWIRPIGTQAHGDPRRQHFRHTGNTAGQFGVTDRAVGDAGAGIRHPGNFIVIEPHTVGQQGPFPQNSVVIQHRQGAPAKLGRDRLFLFLLLTAMGVNADTVFTA